MLPKYLLMPPERPRRRFQPLGVWLPCLAACAACGWFCCNHVWPWSQLITTRSHGQALPAARRTAFCCAALHTAPESKSPTHGRALDLVVVRALAGSGQRLPGYRSGPQRTSCHHASQRPRRWGSSNGDGDTSNQAHDLAGHRCALQVLVVGQVS